MAQKAAVVSLANKTQTDMTHQYHKDWLESVIHGSYPKTISPDTDASFIHSGDQGSRGAVQYSGFDAQNEPFSVILAWDVPIDYNSSTSPNRVYAICGPRSVMDPITWDEIDTLLKGAPHSASSYGVTITVSHESGGNGLVDATISFA